MTNSERQASLARKMVEGSSRGVYWGNHPWCEHCSFRRGKDLVGSICTRERTRDSEALCAKAYNRMVRKNVSAH